MNLNITIKYGGDGSTSQINDVPSACTISKLKKIVAQINKMENTVPIRLVQRGMILLDNQKIGDLYLNNEKSLTIYATGIPGKIHKSTSSNVNLRTPGQLNTPIVNNNANDLQNQKPPIVDRVKDFINQNKKGLIMSISIIILTFSLAYAGIERNGTKIPRPKTYFSSGIHSLMNGQISKEGSLLIFGAVLFLVWIAYIIKKIGFDSFKKCTILFFLSLLPNFDVESFRNEHNLR
ncbi:hypothetical protein M9Y10_042176 [Tritrichomonas musculus]|uniref:Ubiquitin-like domain-containing protein n=1 Tax=Tritrichomonas musculus TaxID=1915356 RepID=A0ABR2K6G9_9EUKA